jgi:hypothetical protein
MGPILCNVVIVLWPGRTRGMGTRRASGTRRGHTGRSGPDSEGTRSRPRLAPRAVNLSRPSGQSGRDEGLNLGASKPRGSVTGWQAGFQIRARHARMPGGSPDRPPLERIIVAKDAPRPDEDGAGANGTRQPAPEAGSSWRVPRTRTSMSTETSRAYRTLSFHQENSYGDRLSASWL